MLTPQTPSKPSPAPAQTGPFVPDDVNLRTRVLIALRWTILSKFVGQLISWTITLYVIRILSPDDYGLMAMASVPLAFFYLLNTAGLDAVLVQRRDVSERLRAQIFGLVIVLNLLFFFIALGVAPGIATFYGEPRLTALIRILSFQFVLLAFETLPQSQLERDIKFGRRSIVELVTIVAGSLIALTLARAGFGVWTLVWGSLATTAIRTAGLNFAQRSLCWPRFSLEGMKSDLRFGWSATVDRALRFTLADSDRFIGGKLFGNILLGYYAVANDLASLPINKLTGLINSIALPAFAKTQLNPAGAGSSLLTVTRLMSLLAFPFFLGMSSIASELTTLLLGPKWQAAAVPLQLLSLIMPLRMLMNAFQPFLWGVGRPNTSASTFLIGALSMPIAFLVGAQWGPVGLSLAWALVYPLVFLASIAYAQSLTGVLVTDILRTMARPILASLFMYTLVSTAKHYAVFGQSGRVLPLAQLVLVGAVTYTGAMLVLDREVCLDAFDLLGAFLGGRPPEPAEGQVSQSNISPATGGKHGL
ncbi:MAG TPA: lipopolysaccharide biosynthesis protein [Methylomirabilota bacterium]|nr:lipopolysaccharide biosynthesis protein [Methylomirabilota bacterium]